MYNSVEIESIVGRAVANNFQLCHTPAVKTKKSLALVSEAHCLVKIVQKYLKTKTFVLKNDTTGGL